MKKSTLVRALFLALALTGSTQAVSWADRCVPNPDIVCPFLYDPVTCNGGVTYSNSCFAAAACAKGCRRPAA